MSDETRLTDPATTASGSDAPSTISEGVPTRSALPIVPGLGASSADEERAGQWVGLTIGDYRLEGPIGRGGYGQVFRAIDLQSNPARHVAVKLLRPELATDPVTIGRFARELKAMADLGPHPNLVGYVDAGEDRGVAFLAMELIEGRSLSAMLDRDGPMPADRAVGFIRQAALGITHAHRAGMVHRDIKPSNLIVDASGVVKVLDWGLARLFRSSSSADETAGEVSGLTASGTPLGTVAYMAPEQAFEARSVDQRCDIYGLGCSLFAMLTGRPPFDCPSSLETLVAHRERPRPSLVDRLGRSDPAIEPLDRLVRRMMARDPNRRPGSMDEVLAALERIDRGERPMTRRIALAATGAGVVTLLAAVLIGRSRRPDPGAGPPSQSADVTDRDRSAAAWVMSQGGSCDLIAGPAGRIVTIAAGAAPPDGTFRVLRADLQNFRNGDYINPELLNDDLAHLADLPRLEFLHLGGSLNITGEGLDRLGELPSLTDLYLVYTGFRDVDIDLLSRFSKLEVLNLWRTRLTDHGLARLPVAAPGLRKLSINQTAITDDGLDHLLALPLVTLYLDHNPQLTADGVRRLFSCPTLRLVGLRRSSLDAEQVTALSAEAPFQIYLDEADPDERPLGLFDSLTRYPEGHAAP